jgi:hypothetical protein
MRALKKPDTAIIDGHRIYYNYIRPHTALNRKTSAEVVKITVELSGNKWQDLIQNASKEKQDTTKKAKNRGFQCPLIGVSCIFRAKFTRSCRWYSTLNL